MRQPKQLIAGRTKSAVAALWIAFLTSSFAPLCGQQSPSSQDTGKADPPAADQETLSESERQALIAGLGSSSFAEREKSAAKIMAIGGPLLPDLKSAAEEGDDLEVRSRASILYRRVAIRDFETRAQRFLASDSPEDQLPGWSAVVPMLGDHQATRELYIEIRRRYPGLTKAYEAEPHERALEADRAAEAIVHSLTVELQPPLPADAIALLLVAADPAVPVSLTVERTLLSLVNKGDVRSIRSQAALETVYDDLLGRWIRRSRSEHRQEVLWLSMQDNLPAGGALALRTLHESDKPATLQFALQAAARFAKPKDAPLIKHLLEDERPAGDGVAFIGEAGERVETRMSDVAMAAIARIHGQSLQEIGFPHAREHPSVAFHVESLGFPPTDQEARKQVRQRIDKLLAPEQR